MGRAKPICRRLRLTLVQNGTDFKPPRILRAHGRFTGIGRSTPIRKIPQSEPIGPVTNLLLNPYAVGTAVGLMLVALVVSFAV